MRFAASLVALAFLSAPVLAQGAGTTNPAARQQQIIQREAPREQSVIDKFDMKTTDTGKKVQQRLELELPKDKDLFVFGNRTTTYPTARNPGQEFQPAIPQAAPKDTYSIGIGRRF
jgi:hypothetical protein